MSPTLPIRVLSLILIAAFATGCPSRTKRSIGGPRLTLPTSGDADARQRFQESRARFERDGGEPAAEFEAIARAYPDDPIAPHALLYAGMASVRAGDVDHALELLDSLMAHPALSGEVRERAAVFRGISLATVGRHEEALEELLLGRELVNTDDREERASFDAAMAETLSQIGRPAEAIPYYDDFYRVGRPAERDYALDRIRVLSGEIDDAAAIAVYDALDDRDGPAAAILGERVASAAEAAGDPDRADDIRDDIRDARESLGLATQAIDDGGDPGRVGALLPLSGRLNRVGDLCMRGLALAAGSFADRPGTGVATSGRPRPFEVSARDSASASARIDAELAALRNDGVIAVVGPFDGRAVEQAARAATRLGMPMVSLTPLVPRTSDSEYVFHIRHAAEDRARALARHAYAAGVRDFAILGPENSYGKTVGAAFREEVQLLGGSVIVESWYPPGTTSFRDHVKRLRKPFQAVFVPDLAKNLQLVAPALAAGNIVARPLGEKAKNGRPVLLLSTAEGVGEGYLRSAGRYSDGAVLAPGFYPDATDERTAGFVSRYREQFGRLPTPYDAYAYDAALVVRAAVESGASGRSQVAGAIARDTVPGLTGDIRFDAAGRRADDGVLYVVDEIHEEQYELRSTTQR